MSPPDPRRSILSVTSEIPWPLDSGGHLRTFHLLHALAQDFHVRLVAGVKDEQPDPVDALMRAGIDVRPVRLSGRGRGTEASRVLSAALHREPYVLYRRHGRAEVRAALDDELARGKPALLYLDHLDSWQFASQAAHTPVIIDLHNLLSRYYGY